MPTLPYFPQPEPEPEVEMVLVFDHMVPLSSVTFSSDSEEVAAPPRPSRPKREMSAEVARRLALRGGESVLLKAADIEREIQMERIEARLASGIEEESMFFK